MPAASGILCARYNPRVEPDTVNSTDFSSELFCAESCHIFNIGVSGSDAQPR